MEKCKCAIDLLWVRPNQVGGIESVVRNILDGFVGIDDDFELWLLVSLDNEYSFNRYKEDPRINIEVCNIKSANVEKRILWQNVNLGKVIKSLGLKKCFEPYYCKPIFGTKNIDFVTIIHDLQALHYPKYFSFGKVLWMKCSWWNTIKSSKRIVAISEFVRSDILSHYSVDSEKVVRIYDPVYIDRDEVEELSIIERKYSVRRGEFFFTVSSLLPHKNIITLLKMVKEIKQSGTDLPSKLIISGVGGKLREPLIGKIKEYGIEDDVQITKFIETKERNALYKYCKAFLFPSVFEGFGMPPIEAMMFNTPVVTTRETCLEEVTQGKANYVDDPYDPLKWIESIKNCSYQPMDFSHYNVLQIAKEYIKTINNI